MVQLLLQKIKKHGCLFFYSIEKEIKVIALIDANTTTTTLGYILLQPFVALVIH